MQEDEAIEHRLLQQLETNFPQEDGTPANSDGFQLVVREKNKIGKKKIPIKSNYNTRDKATNPPPLR